MDYSEEFWESSGNSVQDDRLFLSLSSTETLPINHFSRLMEHGSSSRGPMSYIEAIDPNPDLARESGSPSNINRPTYPPSTTFKPVTSHSMFQPADDQMMGMGNAMVGSIGMDQFHQGSSLLCNQQLQSFAQSRQISTYPYQEAGSSVLPDQPAASSVPLHMTRPHEVDQPPAAPMNTINFLDVRDLQSLEQTPPGRTMPFMSSSIGPLDKGASTDASLLISEAFDQNLFANSGTMQTNTENHDIGSSSYYHLSHPNNNPRIEEGSRAYRRFGEGDAQTWLDRGQVDSTSQHRASLDAGSSSCAQWMPSRRPVMNALYDPIYEQMGLPIDPHLRLFLANQARDQANNSSDNKE